jgi:hypothetical protein
MAKKSTVAAYIREWQQQQKAEANGHVPPGAQAAPPEIFTAARLMGLRLPPPRWAVEGIIPEGLTVLAGKPKLGKSWLVLHVALAVACGGLALGKIDVAGGDVLYISLEDTWRRLQDRLKRLLGDQQEAPAALHLAHAWPRQDRGGLDRLEEWLEAHPAARLVAIDTWGRWRPHRPGKVNDYDTDLADGAVLKGLADRRGVPTLVSNHCRKMPAADPLEEVTGSVGMTGTCDGVLVMRRERGVKDATLMVTGRDLDERELALTFDPECGLWQLAGPAEEFRASAEERAALALFRPGEELGVAEAAALLGKKRDTVKHQLARMARKGQLVATDRGRYRLPARDVSPLSRCPDEPQGGDIGTGAFEGVSRTRET